MKNYIFLLLVFFLGLPLFATEISFDAGCCTVDESGSVVLTLKEGQTITLDYAVVIPKWRFCTQKNLANSKLTQLDPDTITLAGDLKCGKELLPFQLNLNRHDKQLALRFSTTLPEELVTQDKLPPMMIVRIPLDHLEGSLVQMGKSTLKLPANNVFGNGSVLKLQQLGLTLDFGAGVKTFSCWNSKGNCSFRINSPAGESRDEKRFYSLETTISIEDIKLTPPVDMTELKRTQYRRILYPPQEPLFQPAKLIELLDSPKLDADQLGRLEQLLDIRAVLYDAQQVYLHAQSKPAELREMIESGYQQLNELNLELASKTVEALRKLTEPLRSTLPHSQYNPCSWIKSFTQYGFIKHPDGTTVYEPDPYNIIYQDGFRFRIAESPSVELAAPFSAKNYYETRFIKPMPEVTVERSWIDTRWNLPDRKVTFSMLTPVIDVEDTDLLELSGFSIPPVSLSFVKASQIGTSIRFDGTTEQRETIASVLVDAPEKTVTPAVPKGRMQKLNPDNIGRPWLILRSVNNTWTLLLLPGARPIEAGFANGKFSMRLEKKSYIGIVRLPSNVHSREASGIAEFFAGTTLDYPSGVTEQVQDNQVTWRYSYRSRSNAWGLVAHRIAPVSPLAVLGEVAIPSSQKMIFPSKYGLFRYVEGEEVSFTLPELPTLPALNGVNTSLKAGSDVFLEHQKNGAGSQRLNIGRSSDPESTYQKVEELLKFCESNNIQVLIDPHNFQYAVTWKEGFPKDPTPFLELWDRLSQIGARHPQAVLGYDLYNELGLKEGAQASWQELAERCGEIIHRNHPGSMIYVTGLDGANASGYFNSFRPAIEPCCLSFHFYTPHAFTHQKSATLSPNDPFVFYPGYVPHTDWSKHIHYGGTTVEWVDRWTTGAVMLPIMEAILSHRLAMHCGEFGVIGYANARAKQSALIWTRDSCEFFHHAGIQWHLWNGGFGLGNPLVREYIYQQCKSAK